MEEEQVFAEEELQKDNSEYVQPTIAGSMEYLYGESLMLFGWQQYHKKRYRPFYGIGVVYRVVKGEKQDLVYVRFGCFQSTRTRLIVVWHNHARRQIMTLKRGQCCQVYGVCRYFSTKVNINGEEKKGLKLGLYAIAIQGWYVPSMIDIRKMPTNEDLVDPTEKEKDLQKTLESVLDEFLTDSEN